MKPLIYSAFGWKPHLIDRPVQVAILTDYHAGGKCFDIPIDYWRAKVKIFLQIEPPCVLNIIDCLREEHEKFDAILGWHPALQTLPNAVYYQGHTSSLRDLGECTDAEVPEYTPNMNKNFGASFITSSKAWCPGHLLRQEIFTKLPNSIGNFRICKHKAPPWIKRSTIVGLYQFGIEAENSCVEGYFTEKLLDHFLARDIPIYWGCPNLADYGFDMSGIIQFTDIENLIEILKHLTPDTYKSLEHAADNNYRNALYWNNMVGRLENEITAVLHKKGIE